MLCVTTAIDAVTTLKDVARIPREDMPKRVAMLTTMIMEKFLDPGDASVSRYRGQPQR